MKVLTNSFPRRKAFTHFTFIVAAMMLLGLDGAAQRRQSPDRFQKISLKETRPCAVGPTREVTSLVKNGVELSVNEDWDCDGVADAYDNCVGMPNHDQIDADGSGFGDTCEAAAKVRASVVKPRRENRRARGERKSKREIDNRKGQRSRKTDVRKTRVAVRRKR